MKESAQSICHRQTLKRHATNTGQIACTRTFHCFSEKKTRKWNINKTLKGARKCRFGWELVHIFLLTIGLVPTGKQKEKTTSTNEEEEKEEGGDFADTEAADEADLRTEEANPQEKVGDASLEEVIEGVDKMKVGGTTSLFLHGLLLSIHHVQLQGKGPENCYG